MAFPEKSSPLFNTAFSRPRRYLILILAAIPLILLFAGRFSSISAHGEPSDVDSTFSDLDRPRVVSPETAQLIGLKTAPVQKQAIAQTLDVNGSVKPLPQASRAVSSQFSGLVVSIAKQVGERVKKGDLLVRLESLEMARFVIEAGKLDIDREKLLLESERARLDLAQSKPGMRVAQTQLDHYQKEFERVKEQDKTAKVPPLDLTMREENVIRAQSALELKKIEGEVAEKSMTLLKHQAETSAGVVQSMRTIAGGPANAGSIELRADADGIVTRTFAIHGQWFAAGQTILEYADFGTVQIEAEIPEAELARVQKSNPQIARISVAGAILAEGKVRSMSPEIDPQRRTFKVFIEANNADAKLLGNQWVRAALQLGEPRQVLAVPRSALATDGAIRFVFVESGSQFQKQDIVAGLEDDAFVEIKQGLVPGDVVAIQGVHALTQLRPTGLPSPARVQDKKPQ